MEDKKLFLVLLNKYIHNTASSLEHDEFFQLLASGKYDDLLDDDILAKIESDQIIGTDTPAFRTEDMVNKILDAEKQASIITLLGSARKRKIIRWSVAASMLGIVLVSAYILAGSAANDKAIQAVTRPANFMSEKENNTSLPMKLVMDEGTIVTLSPFSKIHFPTHFAADKREVYLEGEAFFKVSKNPLRPFYVYYGNLVTHVLGTSFNVKTDKAKKLVEVSVVTGKVQVYENKNLVISSNNGKKANGVILAANQKVIYEEDKRQFTATLVNDPLPVPPEVIDSAMKPAEYIFRETALGDVLTLLEKSYEIEMIIENSRLNNCLFSGDIQKYDLYTKLDIICQSLNASYEINGTKILIKGKGCD